MDCGLIPTIDSLTLWVYYNPNITTLKRIGMAITSLRGNPNKTLCRKLEREIKKSGKKPKFDINKLDRYSYEKGKIAKIMFG